jgi:hypothetical protein
MAALGQRSPSDIEEYTKMYTSFSGADIVCTFNGTVIGTLSGITWSVTREKAPIYTMGSPNPRSFTRGKRGIAGSLIFTSFDRPALYNLIKQSANTASSGRIWTRTWNMLPNMNSMATASGIANIDSQAYGMTKALPYYADQIPPFDITITYGNEYGQAAAKSIYGCELLNEGSGASMEDLMIEETMTYVAREIGPMIPTNRGFDSADTSIDSAVVNGFGLG